MATRHNSGSHHAAPQTPLHYRLAFAGYLAILALGLASGALSLMGA